MPTVYRVVTSGLLYGNVWNNVLHFVDSQPGLEATIATSVNGQWVEQVKGFQHSFLSWLNISVRDVTTTPGPAAFNLAINKVGTSSLAAAADSNLLTVVLKLNTAIAGPSGRGRVLIAGVPQARFNLGLVEPSVLTIWQNIANNLVGLYGPGGSTGIQLVVAPRSNPANYKPVVTIIVRSAQGTCRSRGYGVGI